MEKERTLMDDFRNLYAKSWCVQIEEGEIAIIQVRKKKDIPVFCDRVLGILSYQDDAGKTEWFRFFHSLDTKVCLYGAHQMNQLCFVAGHFPVFVAEVDGEPLKEDRINRLNIYARTDVGTLVLSSMPSYVRDARSLVAVISKDWAINQIVQQMATEWLYEIFGK